MDTEHTHEVAEKTEMSGGTVKRETRETKSNGTTTSKTVEQEDGAGEPKQIQPDGR